MKPRCFIRRDCLISSRARPACCFGRMRDDALQDQDPSPEESPGEKPRRRKRHFLLRIDSWIDSTVWNAGFRLAEFWEETTIFFRRFHVKGWKRAVFEVAGEGMNLGTAGFVLLLALVLLAIEERRGDWRY